MPLPTIEQDTKRVMEQLIIADGENKWRELEVKTPTVNLPRLTDREKRGKADDVLRDFENKLNPEQFGLFCEALDAMRSKDMDVDEKHRLEWAFRDSIKDNKPLLSEFDRIKFSLTMLDVKQSFGELKHELEEEREANAWRDYQDESQGVPAGKFVHKLEIDFPRGITSNRAEMIAYVMREAAIYVDGLSDEPHGYDMMQMEDIIKVTKQGIVVEADSEHALDMKAIRNNIPVAMENIREGWEQIAYTDPVTKAHGYAVQKSGEDMIALEIPLNCLEQDMIERGMLSAPKDGFQHTARVDRYDDGAQLDMSLLGDEEYLRYFSLEREKRQDEEPQKLLLVKGKEAAKLLLADQLGVPGISSPGQGPVP